MGELGRLLILFGVIAIAVGVAIVWLPKVPLLGKLPGDFLFRRGSTTIYVPLATSIVVSIVLTVLLNLVFWR